MRVRSAALLVSIVCLLPIIAQADISEISPQSIPYGTVEESVTIFGSELSGTESTLVTFDGPAGQFVVQPTNALPNDDPDAPPLYPSNKLVVFIPGEVAGVSGSYQITVTAKDVGLDARTLGPVTFTVQEQSFDGPPLIGYEEVQVEEATSSRGAIVNLNVTAQNPNGDPVPVTCSPESGSQFPMGGTNVTCSATNTFGTTTARIYVLVTDFTAPVVTVPADIVSSTAVVTYEASAVDNIDGALPVTCSPVSGSTFGPGVTQVVCSATDLTGNVGFGFFTVTRPGGAPVITVPANISADSPDGKPVEVPFTVTATNDATIVCLYGPAPGIPFEGDRFDVGTTTLTCTATNLTGSDTKSFSVTVHDLTAPPPPELTVPDDITVEATSSAGAAVTFVTTATNGGTIVCTPSSGSTFALGVTTVSCTATNDGGSDTDSFTVTVVDTTPPQILSVDATPGVLWPPNHQMVNITVAVVAFDVADPTPVSRIISVTSNQPVNGTGDGDTAPDWQITGPLTVKLRSERSHGQDRIYTITVETVDDAGNATTATDTVKVSNSKQRGATH
jgi:hypothetical protein